MAGDYLRTRVVFLLGQPLPKSGAISALILPPETLFYSTSMAWLDRVFLLTFHICYRKPVVLTSGLVAGCHLQASCSPQFDHRALRRVAGSQFWRSLSVKNQGVLFH